MEFLERMAAVAADAKKVRESMTIVDPRKTAMDITPDRGDRRVVIAGPAYQKKVIECAKLIAGVLKGERPEYHLREAMSTSDFPNLMGDVLYRQLLGNYVPYPVTYPMWTKGITLKDFRSLHMYTLDGGQSTLDRVRELAPYPETSFIETPYTVAVAKYGRRYGISFEMVVNDDLSAFNQRPAMMAVGARRSEEYLATQMVVDANGPHASFFTAGHANIVTGNPILSIQGLQTAMSVLAAQTDADGQPIVITSMILMVPPSLKITAENILNATQLRINSGQGNPAGALPGGATIDQFLYTANWMVGQVKLVVNPYLPVINTTSGKTNWYLIANPDDISQRPAFVFAKLRGHETPELFIKDSNQRQLGGGDVSPMEGSFENDDINYKLRMFMGAAQIDPKMAVASNGTEV